MRRKGQLEREKHKMERRNEKEERMRTGEAQEKLIHLDTLEGSGHFLRRVGEVTLH